MNVRKLESFLLACECGSFTKAAERSYITVQSFTQQMNSLERDLGFKLFDRGHRGATLTKAGESFRSDAEQMLGLYRSARQKGLRISGQEAERIRIAFDPSGVAPCLPAIVELLESRSAAVCVELVEKPCRSMLKAIADNEIDVCFYPDSLEFTRMGLQFHPLEKERVFCAVSPSSSLAARDNLTIEDIAFQTVFVEHDTDCVVHGLLREMKLINPRFSARVQAFDASLPLAVSLSKGLFIEMESYLGDCVPPLVPIPLDGMMTDYGLVYSLERRSRTRAPLDLFIAASEDYFASRHAG